MKQFFLSFQGLGPFLTLWSTQSLSSLGSSMTSFALIIWSYQQEGSALTTSLLSVCSYAPYVLLSIFAGALSDKWDKKRTLLLSDSIAAFTTLCVWGLFSIGSLQVWHLYLLNAINGLMNAFQNPASEVAVSLLIPEERYQRAAGLRSFSSSLVTVFTPMIASLLLSFGGLEAVLLADFLSFSIAFFTLFFFISLPTSFSQKKTCQEPVFKVAGEGLDYLLKKSGIFYLILFLSAINFTASVYQAALAPMLLSRDGGGEGAFGVINTVTGIVTLVGSILASLLPAPKSRVRVICNTLLFSMCTENFLLAFGNSLPIWCVGAALGWVTVPLMSVNMDALLRSQIPVHLQGRIYAVRNALQFFTIPVGNLVGGFLVDVVFEPFMAGQGENSPFIMMFGNGKGSGAALLFCVLGILGSVTCLCFRRNRHIWALEHRYDKL